MMQVVRTLILVAGMVGLVTAGGLATAPAQDKKDVKKGAKAGGVIEINEGKDGKFRFVIRDGEGKLLAMSGPTGFQKREDAVKALETLKDVLPTAKMAPPKKAK
jgi:uncharacterized protein YegP (UPF0339 family)